MKYIILFLTTLCLSCGYSVEGEWQTAIDPALENYVDNFRELSKSHQECDTFSIISSIKFDTDLESGILGICNIYPVLKEGKTIFFSQRTIKINKERWEAASENFRKIVMFHELVHCACSDRKHSTISGTLMYSKVTYKTLQKSAEELLKEYFND